MDPFNPLANALHSIYMDDQMFRESTGHGILSSAAFPGSGNIIGGKVVLIKNLREYLIDKFSKLFVQLIRLIFIYLN